MMQLKNLTFNQKARILSFVAIAACLHTVDCRYSDSPPMVARSMSDT